MRRNEQADAAAGLGSLDHVAQGEVVALDVLEYIHTNTCIYVESLHLRDEFGVRRVGLRRQMRTRVLVPFCESFAQIRVRLDAPVALDAVLQEVRDEAAEAAADVDGALADVRRELGELPAEIRARRRGPALVKIRMRLGHLTRR